jgi:hypothetical protein
MKWLIRSGLLFFFMLTSGCVTYHVVSNADPHVGNPNKNPRMVSSLQPALSWNASPDTEATYDLIVYEGIKDQSFWKGTKRSVGDQVYYRESIKGNTHSIQTPLKPKTEYYWAVRIRKGNETSDWSRYDYSIYFILWYMNISNTFFRFRTPDL